MQIADVFFQDTIAGQLIQLQTGGGYRFSYSPDYAGPPISQTMPVRNKAFEFDSFPPFFDGLLPEGFQLEALLRQKKLDRNDHFGQLLLVGSDTVGAVTVREHPVESNHL
ncbi:MAG: toxin HipA [Desulforhopalus sp.]|jgi:serine/threonine-protein kinase HipA|nr:toxin HipA [Desulforhopalus sp.]